jgi:hypothetical protein
MSCALPQLSSNTKAKLRKLHAICAILPEKEETFKPTAGTMNRQKNDFLNGHRCGLWVKTTKRDTADCVPSCESLRELALFRQLHLQVVVN